MGDRGWSTESVLIVVAGIGITFALWWMYFALPFAHLLHTRRSRSFWFGYLHMPLFASIAAVGAGLHVAASAIEGEAHIPQSTVVAAPVAVFIVALFAIYLSLLRVVDRVHLIELPVCAAVLVAAYLMGRAHVPVGWCLLVVAAAPTVMVLAYELTGHREMAAHLARMSKRRDSQ